MPQGLSRFLILHERCGSDFDVSQPAGVGSGRVSITCRGCGARHEYLRSTIDDVAEVANGADPVSGIPPAADEPAVAPPAAPAPAAPPPPASIAPPAGGEEAPPPRRLPRLPRLADRGIAGTRAGTMALLLVAVIAAIVAIARLSGGSDENPARTAASQPGGDTTTTPPQPEQPQPAPSGPTALRTVTTPTYSLAVPTDWKVKSAGAALRITPANRGDVALRVYSDRRPELSLAEMGRLSAGLLRRQHPGSSPSQVHATKLGATNAVTVGVAFDGSSETAFAIAQGSLRYLMLVSVRSNASAADREDAAAVVSSFEPA